METYEYEVLACTDPAIRAEIDRWKAELNVTKWEAERFEMTAMGFVARYKEGQRPNFRACYEAAKKEFVRAFRPGDSVRQQPYVHNSKQLEEDT